MTVALFLAVIASAVVAGIVWGWRFARANRTINRLQRDDAICREVERSERGVYARWWLV